MLSLPSTSEAGNLNSYPIGWLSRSRGRSLLERASVRKSLLPQADQKSAISFSSTGNYDEETDIHEIHRYVLEQFQNQAKEVPRLTKEINELKAKLESGQLRVVDVKLIQSMIDKLQKEIQTRISEEKRKEYLERISPILEEWDLLREKEGPYFKFGEEKKFSPAKLTLIRSFIQVATEYSSLDLTLKPIQASGVCPYCRKPFEDEDGKIVCYECGFYQDSLTYEAEFSDLPRINGASNNNYVNRETFLKALCCYQGKQKVDFPAELWVKFDDYCAFNHVQKSGLNYERTRPIFKSIGYSGFFDDINLFLFMHQEIRKKLPDIGEYESLIIQDYDQFTQKYAEIKGDERDSALNAWYLLYILCRRRRIPCNRCDLKMPDTPAIRISNDNIARKVFEALDWTFEDTI